MKIYDLITACCITLLLFTSASGKVLYYHTDNFGTPMAMTNQAGEVVWQADESPFGEEYETEETPNKNNHRFQLNGGQSKIRFTDPFYLKKRVT